MQHTARWELASYRRRAAAFGWDCIVSLAFYYVPALYGQSVLVFLPVAIYLAWFSLTFKRNQTPGKHMLGIYVLREDGTPAGWETMFVRELCFKYTLLLVMGLTTAIVILDIALPMLGLETSSHIMGIPHRIPLPRVGAAPSPGAILGIVLFLAGVATAVMMLFLNYLRPVFHKSRTIHAGHDTLFGTIVVRPTKFETIPPEASVSHKPY